MSVNLSPIGNDAPFLDASGNPLNAGKLYFYTANSSTPQNTYTTNAGNIANANPVILNSNGYPASAGNVVEIWLTAGVSYKVELQTSTGVTVWTRDYVTGINDTTVNFDQWVSGPAPTYVSATQFTLVGDQTSIFTVGRRVKTTNSGGTVYSRISVSAYGALTTITVVNDSGTLDSGLSAVSYGLLSPTNVSIPRYAGDFTTVAASGNATIAGKISVGPMINSTFAASSNVSGDASLDVRNTNATATATTVALNVGLTGGSDMSTAKYINFFDDGGPTVATGSITAASATTVAYNTSSDERLKDQIRDFSGGLDILANVQARDFIWKKNGRQDYGFIAQELLKVYPYAVSGDPNLSEPNMMIDYGKLTPLLAACIKELVKRVQALESK